MAAQDDKYPSTRVVAGRTLVLVRDAMSGNAFSEYHEPRGAIVPAHQGKMFYPRSGQPVEVSRSPVSVHADHDDIS